MILPVEYSECRQRFIDAALTARLTTYVLPSEAGASGETLSMDTAYIGPDAPKRLLITLSAVHGVEGPAGSGIQSQWLRDHADGKIDLTPDTGVLHIHAANPWGFSHRARTNENNVDLNRNFRDLADVEHLNRDFDEIYDILHPQSPESDVIKQHLAALDAKSDEWGLDRVMNTMSAGQYRHQGALDFGGSEEQWSVTHIKKAVEPYLKTAIDVAIIDFHTGYGDYGETVFLCFNEPSGPAWRRAEEWFGYDTINAKAINPGGEEKTFKRPDYSGVIAAGLHDMTQALERSVTCVVEFGTYPISEYMGDVLRENWAYRGGVRDQREDIVEAFARQFAPLDEAWGQSVLAHGRRILDQAIVGLGKIS